MGRRSDLHGNPLHYCVRPVSKQQLRLHPRWIRAAGTQHSSTEPRVGVRREEKEIPSAPFARPAKVLSLLSIRLPLLLFLSPLRCSTSARRWPVRSLVAVCLPAPCRKLTQCLWSTISTFGAPPPLNHDLLDPTLDLDSVGRGA